jgi:hypothetical protein
MSLDQWRHSERIAHARYLATEAPLPIDPRVTFRRAAEFESALEQRGRKAKEALQQQTGANYYA